MLDAVLLAIALAMDATAVAAARGAGGLGPGDAARLALVFGGFQGGMAALGWAGGAAAARSIAAWDHWLAFGVLAAIGLRMVIEAARGGDAPDPAPLTARLLLVLGVATSIDALAAGVTLPVLAVPPLLTVILIATVTAALAFAGAAAGTWIGARGGRALEAAGGLALIAIGARVLVEHLG